MSINKVILIGNLGKDPEIRTSQSGDKLATFSLATSESWKDKQTGERKSKTDWHSIVVYNNNLVSLCEKYIKKGSKIYLEGCLQTRKWTDKDGVEKYTTEVILKAFGGVIVMLDGKNDAEAKQVVSEPSGNTMRDDFEDEIPFSSMDVF